MTTQPYSQHQPQSATPSPLLDYLHTGPPGVAGPYLVAPTPALLRQPPVWQHEFVRLLQGMHRAHEGWPEYTVTALRRETLTRCNDEQLLAAGITADLDNGTALVYRDPDGAPIPDPTRRWILVPTPDPLLSQPEPTPNNR